MPCSVLRKTHLGYYVAAPSPPPSEFWVNRAKVSILNGIMILYYSQISVLYTFRDRNNTSQYICECE